VSFANVTFFGVGAYGVSLPLYSVGTNWSALVIEFIAAAALKDKALGAFLLLLRGGELALRPHLEGYPREPVSRRSARLPHRLPSHAPKSR
jgi:hypothetical protein